MCKHCFAYNCKKGRKKEDTIMQYFLAVHVSHYKSYTIKSVFISFSVSYEKISLKKCFTGQIHTVSGTSHDQFSSHYFWNIATSYQFELAQKIFNLKEDTYKWTAMLGSQGCTLTGGLTVFLSFSTYFILMLQCTMWFFRPSGVSVIIYREDVFHSG